MAKTTESGPCLSPSCLPSTSHPFAYFPLAIPAVLLGLEQAQHDLI